MIFYFSALWLVFLDLGIKFIFLAIDENCD